MTGYAKLYRSIMDHPRYQEDSEWVHVYVTLLLLATHKGIEKVFGGKQITLQPGQLITSRKSLSRITGIHESSIERILKKLKTGQQIEQVSGSTNRLITLANWDSDPCEANSETNSERTASEQRANTNKNGKNEKNAISRGMQGGIWKIPSVSGFEELIEGGGSLNE